MMAWLAASWHKIVIVLIALDRAWERIKAVDEFVERRTHERRIAMNVPVITQLLSLLEEIFKAHGEEVAKAAGAAAAGAAVETAEADPKVQAITEASVALLAAAQSLKAAMNAQPAAAAASPAAEPEKPAEPAA